MNLTSSCFKSNRFRFVVILFMSIIHSSLSNDSLPIVATWKAFVSDNLDHQEVGNRIWDQGQITIEINGSISYLNGTSSDSLFQYLKTSKTYGGVEHKRYGSQYFGRIEAVQHVRDSLSVLTNIDSLKFETRKTKSPVPYLEPSDSILYEILFGTLDTLHNKIDTTSIKGKNIDSIMKIVDSIKAEQPIDTMLFIDTIATYTYWDVSYYYSWTDNNTDGFLSKLNIDTAGFFIDTISTQKKDSILSSLLPLARDGQGSKLDSPPWLSDCNVVQAKGRYFLWGSHNDHTVDIQYYHKDIGVINQHFESIVPRYQSSRTVISRLISFNGKDIPDYSVIFPITFSSGYMTVDAPVKGPVCIQDKTNTISNKHISPAVLFKEPQYTTFDLFGRVIPTLNTNRVPNGLYIRRNASTGSLKIECRIKR